ncbi:MAG: hypothetical protein WBE69_13640 [Candidatus Binataceae bacterium]|jgi:hypothetical protein
MAVTAVALHWPATIEFLCACAGKRALVPGLVVADDLAYWVQALRLAAAMVARQHFLPDIVEERASCLRDGARCRRMLNRGRWRSSRPRCPTHAARSPRTHPLRSRPRKVVLSGFVERALDHLVRSAAVPAPSASHATIDSLDEQWLAALTQPKGSRRDGPAEARACV